MAREKEIKVEVKDGEEVAPVQEPGGPEEAGAADGAEAVAGEAVPVEAEEKELSVEEKLERQAAETADKVLRLMADFDNYKKRQARQHEELVRSANNRLLSEILEIVDNFERALEHANGQTDLGAFRQGTQLIYNQMKDLLTRHGVEPIEALGKPFDPNLHEAMMQVASEEYEAGLVAMEISRGYRQGDRVLRHSKVGVSAPRGPEGNRAAEEEESEDEGQAESNEK